MARTDRVGEIAGGAPRSGGRGRTGASTTGTSVPKPKVEKAPTMKQKMASTERALTSSTGKDPKLDKTAGKIKAEKNQGKPTQYQKLDMTKKDINKIYRDPKTSDTVKATMKNKGATKAVPVKKKG
jgi:hypothetical protein